MSNIETEEAIKVTEHLSQNMRAKSAHKYIGVGLSTLWLYVKQRKIKAYKLSDRVTIFKKEELDAFINASVEVA